MDYLVGPETTAGMLDASGTIVVDVVCRRCGYNVRGLKLDGRCPECGTPIGLSVSGDLLRFADPGWVEKLALGTRCILWGLAVAVLFSLISRYVLTFVSPVLIRSLGLVGVLLAFYGTWLLTERDPSGVGEDRYANSRKVIRLTLLVGVISNLASIVVQALPDVERDLILISNVGLVAVAFWAVGEFAKLIYLEKLAMRIPDAKYAERARFLRWAFGISLLLLIVFFGLMKAIAVANRGSDGLGGSSFWLSLGCFVAVIGIAVLVFFPMYLWLLYRVGQAFREQAQYARDTWVKAEAAVKR
jgi:hypothetical protein